MRKKKCRKEVLLLFFSSKLFILGGGVGATCAVCACRSKMIMTISWPFPAQISNDAYYVKIHFKQVQIIDTLFILSIDDELLYHIIYIYII